MWWYEPGVEAEAGEVAVGPTPLLFPSPPSVYSLPKHITLVVKNKSPPGCPNLSAARPFPARPIGLYGCAWWHGEGTDGMVQSLTNRWSGGLGLFVRENGPLSGRKPSATPQSQLHCQWRTPVPGLLLAHPAEARRLTRAFDRSTTFLCFSLDEGHFLRVITFGDKLCLQCVS